MDYSKKNKELKKLLLEYIDSIMDADNIDDVTHNVAYAIRVITQIYDANVIRVASDDCKFYPQ